MAFVLKLPKLFGGTPAPAAAGLDMPTTQIRVSTPKQPYDPLASMSLADEARAAAAEAKRPGRVPLVGHLPIVRQFQVLGVLLVTFLVFAAFIMFLDVRTAAQAAASAATATEMQMLSQRLAHGATLASQGRARRSRWSRTAATVSRPSSTCCSAAVTSRASRSMSCRTKHCAASCRT